MDYLHNLLAFLHLLKKELVISILDIGKLYCILIENAAKEGEEIQELISIFSSFISDEISDFQTVLYCENSSYLEESYKAGYLLE